MCVCVLTHPCMQVWKPMTIFSLADHLISDTWPLLLHLGLSALAKLIGKYIPGTLLSLPHSTRATSEHHCGFYVGNEDLKSGPHVCVASVLPTEPSPQPLPLDCKFDSYFNSPFEDLGVSTDPRQRSFLLNL